jgi:hypothetical protein
VRPARAKGGLRWCANAGVRIPGAVRDDRLRLIFTCCHPALAAGAQVALTLRLLGGLTTAEIARLPGTRADHGPAAGPGQGQDPRREDPLPGAARALENFPWNRVAPAPSSQKPLADLERLRTLPPSGVREVIGDGNCGGAYEKPDVQMLEIWRVAVEATREIVRTI